MTFDIQPQGVLPELPVPGIPIIPPSSKVHVSGQVQTGAFSIIEFSGGPGSEPEAACELLEDRFFCLLEGEWDVQVGNDHFRVKAGGSFQAPRGVRHQYRVLSATSRAVVLITRPNKPLHE